MNPFPSSLENSQLPSDPPDTSSRDGSEVVKLSCPVCRKELNLLRKHFGIEGNCVHCETPVKATEDLKGNITVENLSATPIDTFSESADKGTNGSAFGFPADEEPSVLNSHQSPPPFLPEPEQKVEEAEPQKTQNEEEPETISPPVVLDEEVSFLGKPEQQEDTLENKDSSGNQNKATTVPLPWEISDSEDAESPNLEKKDQPKVSLFNEVQEKGDSESASLFEDGTINAPNALENFTGASSPWEEKLSPDSENAGFAATLFTGKGISPEGEQQTSEAADPKKEKSTLSNPSIIKLKSSSTSKKNSSLLRLIRLVPIFAVLGGICYSAIALTPPEKIKEIKEQVKEWLKPGTVLLEYIPFEITGLGSDDTEPEISAPPEKYPAPATSPPVAKKVN